MIHEEKAVKEVKMHKFLLSEYKTHDFAQSQENFARSHDRVTVTFRNSEMGLTGDRVMRKYWSRRIPTTNRGKKVVKLFDTSELISISSLGQPR